MANKKRKPVSKKRRSKNFKFKNTDGAEYEVLFRKPDKRHFGKDCDGICACPEELSPKIHINPYLTKQTELNTVIHEMAHAFFWDKSETEITRFANTCSRFLYNECGWRKTERASKTKYRGK
jgi:Zn-dependent peptidase ImmA (M78 family)